MRLLMLNNEFPPLGGGTGTVNKAIVDRVLDLEWLEIDLVTSARGREPETEQYAERVRLIKVPVRNRNIHHATAFELLRYTWLGYREAVRLHRQAPYDLCMAWSAVPAGWIAWRLQRRFALRYIVRVGGADIPGFEARYEALYPVLSPFIRRIWKASDTVIAKCRREADMIREVDPATRPIIVPNGVDIVQFAVAEPSAEGKPLRLVCVGRLIQRKAQDDIITAVARLRDAGQSVELDLVGTGDEEESYRRLAENLGVADIVRFRGYVPRDRIAEAYASAHVFVLASHNEGMSVSMLEAMAAGLPLVVSRTGGTEELVVEGENGFVFEPGDVDTIVERLRFLAREHDRRAAMGAASRRRSREFTWDAVTARYAEMLAGFAAPRGESEPRTGN